MASHAAMLKPNMLRNDRMAFSSATRPRRTPAIVCQSASGQQGSQQVDSSPQLISKRRLLQTGLASMAMFSCPCCAPKANAAEWFYGDVTGPISWPGKCTTGTYQSPVNVPLKNNLDFIHRAFGPLKFNYQGGVKEAKVLNTGHGTMQVNFPPGNMLTASNLNAELLQFHFHTPSEHAFEGKRYPMEAHLVHRNKDTGGLAVVAVMLDGDGSANPALQVSLNSAPKAHGATAPAIAPTNPADLLPSSLQYIHYVGSLTTPPCSEGVDWILLTNPVQVTDKQILEFMKFAGDNMTLGRNSRPLQPVLNRIFDFEI